MKKQFVALALLLAFPGLMNAEGCIKPLGLELEELTKSLATFSTTLNDFKGQQVFIECDQCEKGFLLDLSATIEHAYFKSMDALRMANGEISCTQTCPVGPKAPQGVIPPPPPMPGLPGSIPGPKIGAGAPPPPPMPNFGAAPASPQGGMPGGLLAAIQAGKTLRKTDSTSSLDSASSASDVSSGKSSPTSGGLDLSQIGSVKLRPTASAASSDTASSGKASPVGGFDPSQIGSVKLKPASARASASVADKPAASVEDSGRPLSFAEKMKLFGSGNK